MSLKVKTRQMCEMVEKSGSIDFFCSVVASVTSQPPNIESLLEIL